MEPAVPASDLLNGSTRQRNYSFYFVYDVMSLSPAYLDVDLRFYFTTEAKTNIFIILDTISASADIATLESAVVAISQSSRQPVTSPAPAKPSSAVVESCSIANDAESSRRESDADTATAPESIAKKFAPLDRNDAAAPSISTISAPAAGQWHHLHGQRSYHGADHKEFRRRKFCRETQNDANAAEQR